MGFPGLPCTLLFLHQQRVLAEDQRAVANEFVYMGTSLIRNSPHPPPRTTLGIGLLWGPRGGQFLISEVPMCGGLGG